MTLAGSYDYSPKGERLQAHHAFVSALRLYICPKEHLTAMHLCEYSIILVKLFTSSVYYYL